MTRGALIQTFSEFFPVFAFFITGQFFSFSTTIIVLVITTLLSIIVSLWQLKHIPLIPLISAFLVIVSGSITVVFNAPDVVIAADSIYFYTFALLIGIGFYQKKQFLERVFDLTFAMTKEGWRWLSIRWFILFILAGTANEIVRITMTPEFWVDYKFTKVLIITTFACYQFTLSRKYRIPEVSNAWGLRIVDTQKTTENFVKES